MAIVLCDDRFMHWHQEHTRRSDRGGVIADKVVAGMGSWRFIIAQTIVVGLWMVTNALDGHPWDPYPFILLNLLFSTQAAYASPLILMSANRAAERDKVQADAQFQDTSETHQIARHLQELLEINNRLTAEVHALSQKLADHLAD